MNEKVSDKTQYTVGIYFDKRLDRVVLILKNRPNWQRGKWNFFRGPKESQETWEQCVVREFKEECAVNTCVDDWKYIGIIENIDYEVHIYTTIQKDYQGCIKTNEDQKVKWIFIDELPKNIIPNLEFLIPYARVYLKHESNLDYVQFATFNYRYE